MKKKSRISMPICEMPFSNLKEFRWRRKVRLGLDRFIIIEERPKNYFTEEEWCQYFKDDFTAYYCIENDLPVPEEVEIRLLKAMVKIDLYIAECQNNNKHVK